VGRTSRRGPESLGRRRFLTLGGHRRIFALTSLAYFRCSGPPLENGIRPKRSLSRVAGRFNLNHDLAQRQSGPPRFAALLRTQPSLRSPSRLGFLRPP
jgi:hypothetical protein